MSKILYIIRGLPGAGKSTLAASLGCPSVSADDFMEDEEGNYQWNRDFLREAHYLCRFQVIHWMESGEHDRIAVANTFTKEREMRPYIDAAEDCGYTVHRIIVENTHGNASIHDVPEETMEKMKNRFSIQL